MTYETKLTNSRFSDVLRKNKQKAEKRTALLWFTTHLEVVISYDVSEQPIGPFGFLNPEDWTDKLFRNVVKDLSVSGQPICPFGFLNPEDWTDRLFRNVVKVLSVSEQPFGPFGFLNPEDWTARLSQNVSKKLPLLYA